MTTLLTYLTSPNPTPSLVPASNLPPHTSHSTHFWWDIRNIRPWQDFTLPNILSTPDLAALVNIPIPAPALVVPARSVKTKPESLRELHELYEGFYTEKVNSALRVALGAPHLTWKSSPSPSLPPSSRQEQESNTEKNNDAPPNLFTLNYANDHAPTIFHQLRTARAIGIVLSYTTWNSGMRDSNGSTTGTDRTAYLRGLSRLHHLMRSHRCRYGFLLTEVELVCVRVGGAPGSRTPEEEEEETAKRAETQGATASTPGNTDDHHLPPLFGHLELSAPIPLALSTLPSSPSQPKAPLLTAPLALLYLSLLSKSQPLPHQPPSTLHVGGPASLTRKRCLDRDAWVKGVAGPGTGEKREAKRRRGWVWPGEGLGRRELVVGRVGG